MYVHVAQCIMYVASKSLDLQGFSAFHRAIDPSIGGLPKLSALHIMMSLTNYLDRPGPCPSSASR